MTLEDFRGATLSMPIIPALRGIQEDQVKEVGSVLLECGIRVFEVKKKKKNAAFSVVEDDAIRSIRKLTSLFGHHVHVTAGTVMRVEDLDILLQEGIKICFSPNLNPGLVREANQRGLSFFPGIETISEAINAITSGAKGLKLFPSVFREHTGQVTVRHTPGFVRYLSKFISCPIIVSGDAFLDDLPASYLSAGAAAINVGAQIFEPNLELDELGSRVRTMVAALKRGSNEYPPYDFPSALV